MASALPDEVRPDFGLEQDAKAWPVMADETPHHHVRVVWQIDLYQSAGFFFVLEQFMSGCTPCRGHVGQKDFAIGKAGHQRSDERFRGTGFSDGNRMYPYPPACRVNGGEKTETFGNVFSITGFSASSPVKAKQNERQDKPPYDGIQNSHGINLQ